MSELHPIAVELATAEKNFIRQRAIMAALKSRRDQLRQDLNAAIRQAITDDPTATNVALAAHFGLRSETSVRRIRASLEQPK